MRVASPLSIAGKSSSGQADPERSNPEQLLALAWATCLNATAQVILKQSHRSRVRVEVDLRDAVPGPGFEFRVDAYLAVEGHGEVQAEEVLRAAHARCPVSKLLWEADTVTVHTEPFTP